MSAPSRPRSIIAGLLAVFVLVAIPSSTSASHSWNGYHWARTSSSFTLKLGNNTSGTWTGLLGTASTDWNTPIDPNTPDVLDTTIVKGRTTPKTCRPTRGRDEICNANYGNTGWLGVAQIWLSSGHIAQGTVKNNDYYFNSSSYQYNNEAEKRHVMCQEVGHTFGLDHQSTDGNSLNTCMDYYKNTSNSDTVSTTPNQHDYDELATIYAHTDRTTTVGSLPADVANADVSAPPQWGKLIKVSADGREAIYERDFGRGYKVTTFVTWVK